MRSFTGILPPAPSRLEEGEGPPFSRGSRLRMGDQCTVSHQQGKRSRQHKPQGERARRLLGVESAGSSSTWKWIFSLGRSWPGKGLGEANGIQTAAGTGLLGHHQSGVSGEHQWVLEVPGGRGAGMGQRSSSGGEWPTHNGDMVITQAGPVSFPAGQTGINAARGAGGDGRGGPCDQGE